MGDLCTMCEQAEAITTWGFPVCQDCADVLSALQGDLKAMEADDPKLADQGRRVEESFGRFLAEQTDDLNGPLPDLPEECYPPVSVVLDVEFDTPSGEREGK